VKVDIYERLWMGLAAVLIALFLAAIVAAAGAYAIQPQSHIETIDPTTVYDDPEFGSPGVKVEPDGRIVVTVVAEMFDFDPDPIEVPAGKPITFRLTSPDVIHGFEIVGTNANSMVIPGYVSQFTMTFDEPGEHLVACNEYCGLLHHNMVGTLIVTEATE
jgi:cytochrome c oxidase subunit II